MHPFNDLGRFEDPAIELRITDVNQCLDAIHFSGRPALQASFDIPSEQPVHFLGAAMCRAIQRLPLADVEGREFGVILNDRALSLRLE
jgi:hypothetical protein